MFERRVRMPPPPAGFHPVVVFPGEYVIFDFSEERAYADETLKHPWGVGKYLERRPSVYVTDLFRAQGVEPRDVHMGVDLFAPVGTSVHAFTDATILHQGYNPAAGDYGHVIVTESVIQGIPVFALYGHLGARSITLADIGDKIRGGELLGMVGDCHENGGYPPHLHFQLSYLRPQTHDMPGAVSRDDLARARLIYPDPRIVLGECYA